MTDRSDRLLVLFFLLAGLSFSIYAWHKPVSDFGNYFYSSHFAGSGKVWEQVYDVAAFNQSTGQPQLFLDHTTVPPQSMLFYLPFCRAENVQLWKFIYNLAGVFVFAFALYRLLRSGLLKTHAPLWLLALPALVPLYYTVLFGQSYTFIAAALIGILLLHARGKWLWAALLLAVVVALKTTPLVLLLYFILKKDWKLVGASLVLSLLILVLTIPVAGYETVYNYYVHIFPRISDGLVSDPYSTSFHGFIVILRRFLSPDALLNPAAVAAAGEGWLLAINGIFSLLVLWLTFSTIRAKHEIAAAFFSLLLFLNLCSGYTSTYSLLLFFPFLPAVKERKDKAALLLLALIMVLPPRLFEHAPVLIAHYKFLLFLAVFLLQLPAMKTNFRQERPAYLLLVLFVFLQLMRIGATEEIRGIRYYAPAKNSPDYVFSYSWRQDSLAYSGWGKQGPVTAALHRAKTVDCLWPKAFELNSRPTVFLPGHWQAKNFSCVNDTVIFLCDYKRGPGLYHIFCLPRTDFDALLKKQ